MPTATTERAHALRLLARCPDGCPEALILAHGFTVPLLADLVSARFVTAELRPARDVWVQITELGREALAQQAAT
jgi:DNA-binding PadR family transcriptional regulator